MASSNTDNKKRRQFVRNLLNNQIFQEDIIKSFRLTPFIVTFVVSNRTTTNQTVFPGGNKSTIRPVELSTTSVILFPCPSISQKELSFSSDVNLTSIDIENYIEMGLRIIRFRMTKLSRHDKIVLFAKFKLALKSFCEKYGVKTWPIAICIDLPNVCIKTGCLTQDLEVTGVDLKEDDMIEITCNSKFWNKCDKRILFMDDPYTFKIIKPGTEITLGCGKVTMFCKEVINEEKIICKIHQGGLLTNLMSVCVRGIKHVKPALSKYDLSMIEFVKEFSLDVIIMNSVRYSQTIKKVRTLFENCRVPLIVSTICEQEGIDNIDDIIEVSDGIILAREFLAYEIVNQYQMRAIQMQISAKCIQRGKPFYVSGNILEESLMKGILIDRELYDVTNAAIEGTGLVLRDFENAEDILTAMNVLDSICKSVESFNKEDIFWRKLDEIKMPVNAAEACCLAGALAAKQTKSKVIILSTVSGSSAHHLLQVAPEVVILTVTCDISIARRLQLHRGVISVVYDGFLMWDHLVLIMKDVTVEPIKPLSSHAMLTCELNCKQYKIEPRGFEYRPLNKIPFNIFDCHLELVICPDKDSCIKGTLTTLDNGHDKNYDKIKK